MTISIIQILIFVSYVTFIIYKFGVLSSISESWYSLKNLGGLWHTLFTWFCTSLGFLTFFQTNDTAPQFFFLSGLGLTAVGAAAMFKMKDHFQPYIHTVGAIIGILGSLIGIGFERHNWIPLICFIIIYGLMSLFIKKNKTWWIEIAAFVTIGVGLLITS